MAIAMPAAAVVFFSILAFWKLNAILFMLTGGASICLGLFWYDTYTTSIGLSMSLIFLAYSFVCFGFAFRMIFWKNYDEGE